MPFYNRNVCKTFKLTCTGAMQNLSAVLGSQECTEVVARSRTTVEFFDPMNPTVGFGMISGEEMTFRGLTNISQLSANGTNGGVVYLRTQYYGTAPGL
jgi:hypothetical protein